MGRRARKPAGRDGNGADRAPRCERSISAQCERPTPGPRRARCGRGAGVSRDAALAPANRALRTSGSLPSSSATRPLLPVQACRTDQRLRRSCASSSSFRTRQSAIGGVKHAPSHVALLVARESERVVAPLELALVGRPERACDVYVRRRPDARRAAASKLARFALRNCSDLSEGAASGRSNRCAKTAPFPRSRSPPCAPAHRPEQAWDDAVCARSQPVEAVAQSRRNRTRAERWERSGFNCRSRTCCPTEPGS